MICYNFAVMFLKWKFRILLEYFHMTVKFVFFKMYKYFYIEIIRNF